MKDKNIETFTPEFIKVPYQLVKDKTLTPTDRMVYGAVYWFSKLNGGGCFASNTAIAGVLFSSSHTISKSLGNLEQRGYIMRTFFDETTKSRRKEIIPTVFDAKILSNILVPSGIPNGTPGSPEGIPQQGDSGIPNGTAGIPDGTPRYPRWDTSTVSKKSHSKAEDKPKISKQAIFSGVPKGLEIENRVISKNNNIENSFSPSGQNEMVDLPDRFVDQVGTFKKFKDPSEIPHELVTASLTLFLPLFPNEFATKNVFAIKAYHTAIKNVLMTTSFDDLKRIVEKYHASKSDRFRPGAGGVFDFCRYQFAKIEAYVSKTEAGLWAQKSISTPEQRADSDVQMKRIIDAGKERVRKDKEEWEKTHPKK